MKIDRFLPKTMYVMLILAGQLLTAGPASNAVAEPVTTDIMSGKHLRIRVYLEGALINASNVTSSQGKSMMRDDLRVSPFDNKNYIPTADPYTGKVSIVDLSKYNSHVGMGSSATFSEVQDPQTVFSVSGENAIVDWVFVEIRSSQNLGQVLTTRSALLQRDGDVVDVDGVSDLHFPDLTAATFRVVIKHRNHLGAMSIDVDGEGIIDFTDPQTPVFDFGNTLTLDIDYSGLARKVVNGVASLWAGNFNNDNLIKFDAPKDDHNIIFIEQHHNNNSAFGTIGYFQGDMDMDSRVKYLPPSDDFTLLQDQILNYTLNTKKVVNFNYLTEQVPPRN